MTKHDGTLPTRREPESEARTWRRLFEANPSIVLLVDPVDGRIVDATETACAFYGYSHDELVTMRIGQINMQSAAEIADRMAAAAHGPATRFFNFRHRLASGEIRNVDVYSGPLRVDGRTVLQSVIHDVTDRVAAESERNRLIAAVDEAAEAVVITDADARIVYVNPAFERTSGYARSEVLGQNPRMLHSGLQDPEFYTAMWATLLARGTWHGEFVNRRKDGRTMIEEASISPILAGDGTLLNYVAVKRDVTMVRAVQAELRHVVRDQAAISQISTFVADLHPGAEVGTTAAAICERILTLPRVEFVAIGLFLPGDRIRTLAAVRRDHGYVPVVDGGGRWPEGQRRRAREIRAHLNGPPQVRPWTSRPSPLRAAFDEMGITALAEAAVRCDGEDVGFVQFGASGGDAVSALEASYPMLTASGVLASIALAPQISSNDASGERRSAVRRQIESRAFRPVFQPIVALSSGTTVGFEALTRFADGTPPDANFAAAAAVGLGVDLEIATLEAALTAATSLPPSVWLNVNVSSQLVAETSRLACLLEKAGSRPIVLEITEHEAIEDYDRIRAQIAELGIPVRVAVDDAGAGFASLRHILELKPDVIKLDRSLVADIDGDPVRQALVTGLQAFASKAGSTIIAEGIETDGERLMLTRMGVDLGQGYLLGKPTPVARVRRRNVDKVERTADQGAATDRKAEAVVHQVGAIMWEADAEAERMTFVSEATSSLTGHPASRWLAERHFWDDHVHPDDRPRVLDAIANAVAGGHRTSLEYRFRLADGTYRWFEDLVEVLPGEAGHSRLVGVMIDITERRNLEDELAYRAGHDSLTGLLNREALEERITADRRVPPPGATAVLFLDLDDFKLVNDGLGHGAGDEVLRLTARRLRSTVRASDHIARFGGDEFMVYATADNEEALLELGRRVVGAIGKPARVRGRRLRHGVSAGIAFITAADTAETAIRNADLAMYVAKREGGNVLRVFVPEMHRTAVGRMDRGARLGGAVSGDGRSPAGRDCRVPDRAGQQRSDLRAEPTTSAGSGADRRTSRAATSRSRARW